MRKSPEMRSVRQPLEGALGVSVATAADALPELHLCDELLARADAAGPLARHSVADTQALLDVARWSRDFLTRPHPELGRSGHVCPYVSATIREQRFLLTVLRRAATERRQVERAILRLGQFFTKLQPAGGRAAHKKTIVILFPDLPEQQTADIINGLHQRLKPHFLRAGMMLGEFYRGSTKPGLHNPDFRPLRSDVPLLVIRAMLPVDIAFLSDQARFIRAYIRNFGARGCTEIRNHVQRQGEALPVEQRALLLGQVAIFETGVREGVRSPAGSHLSGVRRVAAGAEPAPRILATKAAS